MSIFTDYNRKVYIPVIQHEDKEVFIMMLESGVQLQKFSGQYVAEHLKPLDYDRIEAARRFLSAGTNLGVAEDAGMLLEDLVNLGQYRQETLDLLFSSRSNRSTFPKEEKPMSKVNVENVVTASDIAHQFKVEPREIRVILRGSSIKKPKDGWQWVRGSQALTKVMSLVKTELKEQDKLPKTTAKKKVVKKKTTAKKKRSA